MIPDPLAEVLMHALGLDERRRAPWRNYYVIGAHRADRVAQLVALGFMEPTRRPGFLHADDRTFRVTTAGQVEALAANERLNPPPKRSAARYRAWLDSGAADCGITFGDFLKHKLYHRMNA